jgi:hypothetical protein
MARSRYTGKPGKHYAVIDGETVTLEPGQTVELSDTGALAFRDRFEPVDTPPVADPAPADPKAESKKPAPAAGGGVAKK